MTTYLDAGVDLQASDRLAHWLKPKIGGLFGGMVPVSQLKRFDEPVLISSMDGIGTKVRLARRLGRLDRLGDDIVHHCVNDIAVHGATPLLFMDYLAFNRLDSDLAKQIILSIEAACDHLEIELAGGETAEMPMTYRDGEFDVAGAIVGVAERARILDGSTIQPGDVIYALPSNGAHTNGYSLIQSLFDDADYSRVDPPSGRTWGDLLLEPHRCYLREIQELMSGTNGVRAFAHITGGGIPGNVSRVVPEGLTAEIRVSRMGPVFEIIRSKGVSVEEMANVFNLGIGLCAICAPSVEVDNGWERVGSVRAATDDRRVDLRL